MRMFDINRSILSLKPEYYVEFQLDKHFNYNYLLENSLYVYNYCRKYVFCANITFFNYTTVLVSIKNLGFLCRIDLFMFVRNEVPP